MFFEGKVLDGRNRYRCAMELQMRINTRPFVGSDADALAYVISTNLHRRHLTESQRAMVANKLATLPAHRPETASIEAVTQSKAADMLNVGRSAVQRARKVEQSGDDSLIDAVIRGDVSVSAASDVSELPKAEQAEIVARGKAEILAAAKTIRAEDNKQRQAANHAKIAAQIKAENPALPQKKYAVIYADPPWRYDAQPMGDPSRAIENHYPTMPLDDIKALPISDIAYDKSVLFLWATAPQLKAAQDVMEAWGFTYKTCAVWDKELIGLGFYFRNQHELLLVGNKGGFPTPVQGTQPTSVYRETRQNHSVKPARYYGMINDMYPEHGKIELFARKSWAGWDCWGNMVGGSSE